MAHLLNSDAELLPAGRIGAKRFFVRGVPFDNAAAKFWTTLIDELVEIYPACDEVCLEADTGGLLTPILLNPEKTLQSELENLKDSDIRHMFDEIVAALEVVGLPCPVRIALRGGGALLETRDLPIDCVDAEIVPFLLVWLLEWGTLAEFAWNDERVAGEFRAEDRERGLEYDLAFALHARHLSEGLYHRRLDLRFTRGALVATHG